MTENTVLSDEKEKIVTAKNCSKGAMIFASAWVAILTILRGLKIVELEETDIIYSGVSIVAMWSPTYLSMWLDKIKAIRFGDAK